MAEKPINKEIEDKADNIFLELIEKYGIHVMYISIILEILIYMSK